MATLKLKGNRGKSLIVCLKRIMAFGIQQEISVTGSLYGHQHIPHSPKGDEQKVPTSYGAHTKIWTAVDFLMVQRL